MTWQEEIGFNKIPLVEVLQKSNHWIEIEEDKLYRLVTVRMWGQGVVERTTVNGSEISAKRMLVIHPNQFIISRIDARHGASGIVPVILDGAVVTNDFPVYDCIETKLLPAFLGWLSKTNAFIEACKLASEGTTNRVRLKEDLFLRIEIPLPSLEEQQRIVARIQGLVASINEARGLHKQSIEEIKTLIANTSKSIFQGQEFDYIEIERVCEKIIDYRGRTPPISGHGIPHITSANVKNGCIDWNTSKFVTDDVYKEYMVRGIPKTGDVIFTMEAPLGEAAPLPDNRKFSLAQRVLLLRGYPHLIDGNFLAKALTTPVIRDIIYEKATGTTVKGISSGRLKKIRILVPPLPEQKRIVAYLDTLQAKIDNLKRLQAETTAELDALLPSILDKAFRGEL